jgi:hypothetical protein
VATRAFLLGFKAMRLSAVVSMLVASRREYSLRVLGDVYRYLLENLVPAVVSDVFGMR